MLEKSDLKVLRGDPSVKNLPDGSGREVSQEQFERICTKFACPYRWDDGLGFFCRRNKCGLCKEEYE